MEYHKRGFSMKLQTVIIHVGYDYKVTEDNCKVGDKTFPVEANFDAFCNYVKNLEAIQRGVPRFIRLKRLIRIDDAYIVQTNEKVDSMGTIGGNTTRDWVDVAGFTGTEYFNYHMIVVPDGKVPTVADLRNTDCHSCKSDCNLCERKCFAEMPKNADKPAYYNNGFVYGILPLDPKYFIVVNQKDCKHLYPKPDDKVKVTPDGINQELFDFFQKPKESDIELLVNGGKTLNVLIRASKEKSK